MELDLANLRTVSCIALDGYPLQLRTYPGMAVLAVPASLPAVVVDHNRVHVIDTAVIFAGPLERVEDPMRRVAGVEAEAFPLADEELGGDGLELVKHSCYLRHLDTTIFLGQVVELLFGSSSSHSINEAASVNWSVSWVQCTYVFAMATLDIQNNRNNTNGNWQYGAAYYSR